MVQKSLRLSALNDYCFWAPYKYSAAAAAAAAAATTTTTTTTTT